MSLSDPLDIMDRAATDTFDILLVNIRIVENLTQWISIKWLTAIHTQLTIDHLVLPESKNVDFHQVIDFFAMNTSSVQMLATTKYHFLIPTLLCSQVQTRHHTHSSP